MKYSNTNVAQKPAASTNSLPRTKCSGIGDAAVGGTVRRCSTRSDVLPRVSHQQRAEQQQADGCGFGGDGGTERTTTTDRAIGPDGYTRTRHAEMIETSSLGGGSVDGIGLRRRAVESAAAASGFESPSLCNGKLNTGTTQSTTTATASSSAKSSTVTNPTGGTATRRSFSAAGGQGAAADLYSVSTVDAAIGELPDSSGDHSETATLTMADASTDTPVTAAPPKKSRPRLLAFEVRMPSLI